MLYAAHVNGATDVLYRTADVVTFTSLPSTLRATSGQSIQFGPNAVKFGPGGNVFVATNDNGFTKANVFEYDPYDGSFTDLVFGLSGFNSFYTTLAYDAERGRLYVASDTSGSGTTIRYWNGSSWTEIADDTLLEPNGDNTFTNSLTVGKGPNAGLVFTLSGNQPDIGNRQRIYRYDPDSDTWAVDIELTVASVFGQTFFNGAQLYASETGEIYLLTDKNSGTQARYVFQRSAAGVWSNITEATMSASGAAAWGWAEFGGDLYVGWFTDAFSRVELWRRTAAGVWSLDFDLLADDPSTFGVNNLVEHGGELYAFTGSPNYMLKRTGVATWVHVTTPGELWSGDTVGMSVTDVVPGSGSIVGGDLVEVVGTGFETGAEVVFDNVYATDVTVVSDMLITCRVPAHVVPAFVDVTVTNPDFEFATGESLYEYTQPIDPGTGLPEVVPTISWMGSGCVSGSVAPASGPMSGGTAVTIHGAGFRAGSSVYFGGELATSIVVDPSGSFITCVTPPHQTGAVEVKVVSP